jgi:hypothetical protein
MPEPKPASCESGGDAERTRGGDECDCSNVPVL